MIVKFLYPFPLLITCDNLGTMYMWLTKPHPDAGSLAMKWTNSFTVQKSKSITAIDSNYNMKTGVLLLLVADETGSVRIQDLTAVKTQLNLQPVDIVANNAKRTPYRVFPLTTADVGKFSFYRNENDDGNDSDDSDDGKHMASEGYKALVSEGLAK